MHTLNSVWTKLDLCRRKANTRVKKKISWCHLLRSILGKIFDTNSLHNLTIFQYCVDPSLHRTAHFLAPFLPSRRQLALQTIPALLPPKEALLDKKIHEPNKRNPYINIRQVDGFVRALNRRTPHRASPGPGVPGASSVSEEAADMSYIIKERFASTPRGKEERSPCETRAQQSERSCLPAATCAMFSQNVHG